MNYWDILLADKLDGKDMPPHSYQLQEFERTGQTATFTASALPMPTLSTDIEPSQDLHGYDKPWAGGEGKNKLYIGADEPQTINGVTCTVLTDDDGNKIGLNLNGTATDAADFWFFSNPNLPSGQYYVSTGLTEQVEGLQLIYTPAWAGVPTSAVVNGEIEGIYISVGSGTVLDDVNIYPMICLNSESDKTFEPYSNICPISGVDTIDIDVGGKNKLYLTNTETTSESGITITAHYEDSKLCGYELSGTSEAQVDYSALQGYGSTSATIPSGSYKLTCDGLVNGIEIHVGYGGDTLAQMTTSEEVNIEAPNGVAWLIVRVKNGIALDNATIKPMIRLATETNPTFEPYVNENYTIDLDGTRYGGQLDVTSGVLTLTHGEIASYDGESLPSTWLSDRDEYEAGTTPTTGAQVVYELATPQTIQLTPTQVWAVQGNNEITTTGQGLRGSYFKAI